MPSVHEWTGVLLWMEIISKMVLKLSAQTDDRLCFKNISVRVDIASTELLKKPQKTI